MDFVDYGIRITGLDPDQLSHSAAKKTLDLCLKSGSFDVIELRKINSKDNEHKDIIVVDCINDQVPSRNEIGIKVRERLALVFQENKIPEVRALRKDFPLVSHLNHVPPNEPASLCLYFQNWSAVERTWTPQKHLQRVFWWLSETAKNSLHRDDQPLERLYFQSPFEIVLPPDYKEKYNDKYLSMICCPIMLSSKEFKVIRVKFVDSKSKETSELPNLKILTLNSLPVVHGQISFSPNSLGHLHDQYIERGFDFYENLCGSIKKLSDGGVIKKTDDRCLIIINTPIRRKPESDVEKIFTNAFHTTVDLSVLGQATGILEDGMDGKLYAITIFGDTGRRSMKWRELEILPVEVKEDIDRSFAQKHSGIEFDGSNFNGVVIGVGALGSAISDIWAKEAWGNWVFVDHDIIKPHNTIRHIARNSHVGIYKAEIVKGMTNENFHPGYYTSSAIVDKATNWDNQELKSSLESSDLIVDISTTLDVPRELSLKETIGRSCSLFVTPSGMGSVLMLEDKDRKIRIDSLEAQYYRAVINNEWGKSHLTGHLGNLWVGASCRDLSAVISFETIQLHAATLARQLRIHQNKPDSLIRIWKLDDENGSLIAETVISEPAYYAEESGWRIVWDLQIEKKLQSMRYDSLPKETGGIILGYVDHKIRSIFIVDVLPAPYDSESDQTGFTRGVTGLNEILKAVAARTANIVGYIGEWHSHPAFASANPSSLDWKLIHTIGKVMETEGQPAVMIIAGTAGEISLTVNQK
jgi:hypothetical protein